MISIFMGKQFFEFTEIPPIFEFMEAYDSLTRLGSKQVCWKYYTIFP